MREGVTFKSLPAVLTAAILWTAAVTPIRGDDRVDRIDKLIHQYHRYGQFSGVVLAAEGERLLYRRAVGSADREQGIPLTPDTKFRIFQLTKPFTAVLILQLAAEGRLKLAGAVSDYLPCFNRKAGSGITIHHLLTDSHGLADPAYPELPPQNVFITREFIGRYISASPDFEPGSRLRESLFTGYTLLGAVIEEVTGRTYEAYLRERILGPLEMRNSGIQKVGAAIPHRACQYRTTYLYDIEKRVDFFDLSCNGASAMYASVDDLFRWTRALFSGRLLPPESLETMLKPYIVSRKLHFYGYGLHVSRQEYRKAVKTIVWHGDANTFLLYCIEDRITVILLSNIADLPGGAVCFNILRLLYRSEVDPPRKSLASYLFKVFDSDGIDAAVQQYRRIRDGADGSFDLSQTQLNTLGYRLLRIDKTDAAVEIFKLNAQFYPDSWNAHDSLGEACLIRGDKQAAVDAYTRALSLNPRQTQWQNQVYRRGKKLLKRLKREM